MNEYPFDLSAVQSLNCLEFHPKVTYFVGENGMGKSTLMEAIAVGLGFNPEGGTLNFNFSTEATHSELYQYLRLSRSAEMAMLSLDPSACGQAIAVRHFQAFAHINWLILIRSFIILMRMAFEELH